MTIVCGDSHTSTHGAFGSLAFGIGTSEVEHVLATQCLPQNKPKTMQIHVSGKLAEGVTRKIWRSESLAASAPTALPDMSSSTPATRCGHCRWKAA